MQEELIQANADSLPKMAAVKYQVELPMWTGPYDLLLKVIDDQELDLLDLNISILLDHYLAHLQALENIDIDEAGEFLVVAATLAQIKSKLLLPVEETEEEEEIDPRAELVRYLQEYKRIKQAADELRERPILGRDVFGKGAHEAFQGLEGEGRGKLFQLVKGFQNVLREVKAVKTLSYVREEISVGDRIQEIHAKLKSLLEARFEDVLREGSSKTFVIASFLAILELVRMRYIRLAQADLDSPIFLQWNSENTENLDFDSEFDAELEAKEDLTVEGEIANDV